VSVQPDEDIDDGFFSILAGTRFDIDITKGTRFSFEYAGQLTRKEIGESSHFIVTSLQTRLTEILFFDTTFTWNRISNPKPEEDGAVPEPDDYRLAMGFGVNF